MIYVNYLRLLISSVLITVDKVLPVYGVECVDCTGLNCFGPTCEGDYCMIAVYEPRTGIKDFNIGESKIIKGCVTGTLLKQQLKDECERFDEAETEVRMCLCDQKLCNHKIHEDKMKTQKSKLVTCYCSNCPTHTCEGEYCTYTSNENGEDIIQGCSNRSLPLIERKGEGACMTPPFSPNFIQKKISEGFKREVCLCSTAYCNGKRPKLIDSTRMKCKMRVKMTLHGAGLINEELGDCSGEHCFDVEMKAKDESFTYAATGCMSFVEGREVPEELNDEGCVNFTSSVIEIKACFDTTGKPHRVTKPPHQPKEGGKGKGGGGKGKQNKEEAGKVGKVVEQHGAGKPGTTAVSASKHNKNEPYKGAESTTEEPEDGDSNTTIVVVFVVIMVIIVIAGVVWKFELHKKIFQARYQTVAG